jgi:RIO kinase 1
MSHNGLKESLFSGGMRATDYSYDGNDTDNSDEEELAQYESGRNGTVKKVDLAAKPNTQAGQTTAKVQPASMDSKVLRRIQLPGFDGEGGTGAAKANQKVLNELREATAMTGTKTHKDVDASERATVENVLDPRTRLILYKLVNGGFLSEINGCVSTGKEANVYYAVTGASSEGAPGDAVAIKIYKTSILVFKDREQYVSGEFRFQRYCKSNPRKMVRTWAEKEARNLTRLIKGGINAPKVRLLRQHVLIMDFIGTDGWPSPRLKDVRLSSIAAFTRVYFEVARIVRDMFHACKLVHGDLSEYNLLYHEGKVMVIDVAQSVEHDHPQSLDFLRRDIVNVNAFFRQKKVECLFKPQEFYEFVVSPDITDVDAHIEAHREVCIDRVENDDAAAIDEQVFLRISVPRRLDQVRESKHTSGHGETQRFVTDMLPTRPESKPAAAAAATDNGASESARDEGVFKKPVASAAAAAAAAMVARMQAMRQGGGKETAKTGEAVAEDSTVAKETATSTNQRQPTAAACSDESSGTGSSSGSDAGSSDDDEEESRAPRKPREVCVADMSKEDRKAHTKAVKEAQAAKRQEKVPKHVKRRACKQHKKK